MNKTIYWRKKELWEQLVNQSIKEDISISRLIEKAIKEYLQDKEPTK